MENFALDGWDFQGEPWTLGIFGAKSGVKKSILLNEDKKAALASAEKYLEDKPSSAVIFHIGSRRTVRHAFVVVRYNANTIRLVQSWEGIYSLATWISTNHGLNNNEWKRGLLQDRAIFFSNLKKLVDGMNQLEDKQYKTTCQNLFYGKIPVKTPDTICQTKNRVFLKGGILTYPFIYNCNSSVDQLSEKLKKWLQIPDKLRFLQKISKIFNEKTTNDLKNMTQKNQKNQARRLKNN